MDKVTISEADRRPLGLGPADCVERALPLFNTKAPSDPRPREAIEDIRAFVGEAP
ncbi:putative immunity protein [Streptomyces sp. NPDC096097]|uniref:putative immunity protein n=1 Tax=Streptomyces sp. NPDC096097 TaxID=3155546 RepID=UPI003317F8AE